MSSWPPPPDDRPGAPLPPISPPPSPGSAPPPSWPTGTPPPSSGPPPGWQAPPPPPGVGWQQPPGQQWSVPLGYGTPYGAPPASASNQLSLISMIMGIVSIVATPCCGFVSFPLAIGAVATGVIALSQLKDAPMQQGKGQAIAGIACGAFGLVVLIGLIILQVSLFTFTGYG